VGCLLEDPLLVRDRESSCVSMGGLNVDDAQDCSFDPSDLFQRRSMHSKLL